MRGRSLKIFLLTQQPQTSLPNGSEFHMRTEEHLSPQLTVETGLTEAFLKDFTHVTE